MAYIMQADRADGNTVSLRADARRQALAAAVDLVTQGCTNIQIVGGDRVYTMEELATAIINAGTDPA